MEKYWFKSKSYGWGWQPASREGWIVTVGFVVFLLWLSWVYQGELNQGIVSSYMTWVFGSIILLIIICWKTGEKPHWKWGNKKSDD